MSAIRFVSCSLEAPICFIDGFEKSGEAGSLVNGPCAVEGGSQERQIALGEQTHRNNPVVQHGMLCFLTYLMVTTLLSLCCAESFGKERFIRQSL